MFPYWHPTVSLNKELSFMSALFNPPTAMSLGSSHSLSRLSEVKEGNSKDSNSELGPMSHKLARICSENSLSGAEDQSKKPLLFGFDETQSRLLGSGTESSGTQQSGTETSYQNLISQLVDKVTKDMYSSNQDQDSVDRETDKEKGQDTNFGTKFRGRILPHLMPFVSEKKQGDKGKQLDIEDSQQSAFKGGSDSIEILRKLKHKVLKKSPQRKNPPCSTVTAPTSTSGKRRSKAASRARRCTSKNDVNASLMCSPFHAAQ